MRRNSISALLSSLAAASLVVLPALAQGQQQGQGSQQQGQQQQQQGKQRAPGQEQKTDAQVEQFITKVAHNGHAEVALAQLALRKSNSDQVKAVAQKLLTDHTAVNQKVMALASERNITIRSAGDANPPARGGGQPEPLPLQPEHRATYDRLDKLSGAAFDRAWADYLIKGHQASIDLFTKAATFTDAGVKAFAEQTLPTLREHLKRLQEIQP